MKKTALAALLALSLTGPSLAAGLADVTPPPPPQTAQTVNPDPAIHIIALFFIAIGILGN
ncbi:hypothetical protein [Histidinibacterium lentulum]|uniref:Uncharacterized protein n=1 Tax=Histidinibacterium lentulum TaxID=2480588 RepID=A0A3N2R9W5_9RHOB|nr:hypothetical protein [Histidinibacterium lentulum]ROU04259.1 hypothetical protein EAT49_02390 [Histidinibacterium lentulum]